MAKYPGTLETNNINEFGIVFADQIQGHRSVSNLDSLYKLTVAQLSKSKNNNGNDAIGQEWYVISESKKYKLIDWTKRNQTGGWEAINNVSEDEFNKKLNELEQKIVNNIDWKETVNTFADIATTYPNPQDGWTVSVKDTNKIYRYDAESKTWIPIFENTTELATASRNGLMSATYAKKLDGIEAGANKYIHPTSHPATIITQDSTHRFVTDAEKTLWNKGGNNPFPGFGGDGSANTASRSDHTHDYTTIKTDANHRWITDTLLTKLNGIETGANKYIHPSTHPATIITQDSTHRFVTDTEKTTWNNKADANHTHSVVETANRLTQYNLTNQDLNTIKGSDYYNKFFYAAGGEATTNKPSDVNAYGLIVLRSAGGHTTQLLTSTNLNTGLYWRGGVNDNLGSWKKLAFITDNVASATKLLKPRTINGTNFDGSVNITTSIWGTTRNITIGNTKKTVNGSADVAWSLTEIGAAASNHNHDSVYAKLSHTHTISQISDRNTGWDALLKAAPSGYVTRWPSISEVTSKQNLLINLNGGTTEGTNQFTYNATAAKTINITAASIGAAASSHTHSLSQISALHSSWDALLKAAPSGYVTRWPSWNEVTGKPSSFTPATHSHNTLDCIELSGTVNLNTLNLASGTPEKAFYICKTDSGGVNITGRPNDNTKTAFLLVVELIRWASTSDYISKQTYIRGQERIIWVRYCTNGSWSSWSKIYTSEFKPTPAEIGAAASSHTHTISQISDRNTGWDALLKAAPSGYVTRWPSISEVTSKQNLLIKLNGGTTEGTNQFTYNATAAKTINITAASIGAAASNHNHDSVYAKLSHTHPLSQISDLHSSWDAVLKAQYQSPTVDTTKLVKNSGITTLNSPTWNNGQVKIQFGLNFITIGFGNGSYYIFSTLKNEAEHLKFYNVIDKKFYRAAYLEKEQTWSAYQDFASGAGNSGSDMRFKVNIKPFENVLDKIKNLEIIEYKWNKKGEERDTFGLNATQIKKLFPKMWHQRQDKEKTEWLEYDRTGVIALKAIQELINENNSLKNDIEYLKKEIQNLKNK